MTYPLVSAEDVARVFTDATSPFSYTPGIKYMEPESGAVYRFTKNGGAATWVIGDCPAVFSTDGVIGTGSMTAGTMVSGSCCGVAQAAAATGNYAFCQTDGPNQSLVATGGAMAAGAKMVADGTNGQMATASAATEMGLGVAHVADGATGFAAASCVLAIP